MVTYKQAPTDTVDARNVSPAIQNTLPYRVLRHLIQPMLNIDGHSTINTPDQIYSIISTIGKIQEQVAQRACHIDWIYLMPIIERMMDQTTLLLWKWDTTGIEPSFLVLLTFLGKRLQMLVEEAYGTNDELLYDVNVPAQQPPQKSRKRQVNGWLKREMKRKKSAKKASAGRAQAQPKHPAKQKGAVPAKKS